MSSGVQLWTVPADGTYQIEAYGAQGGPNHCGHAGAKGARMQGIFSLTKNTVLHIVVGQMGDPSPGGNCANGGGGGGGGSFVWESGAGLPLIVAGGGGGSSLTNPGSPYYLGIGGLTSEDGSPSRDNYGGGSDGGDGSNDGGKGWNPSRQIQKGWLLTAITMAQVVLVAAAEEAAAVEAMSQVVAEDTLEVAQAIATMQQEAVALTTQAQPNPTQGTPTPVTAR